MLKLDFPNDALAAVLARAGAAPYYRGRFKSSGPGYGPGISRASWRELPLTRKENLRQAYPFGLLAVPYRDLSTYHESSGTSGQPISSYFTTADWDDVLTRFSRSSVGLTAEDMVLIKTPYSLVTTAHQMHGAARLAGATVVPADNRSQNMPYSRVLRLLRDLPITVAWCMPTEALIWAHLARRAGLSPERDFPNLRAFLVAGEALSPAKRVAISKAWGGKRVIEDYGSTETGSLAGECAEGKLHLWTDRIYCETENDSLVVTPLYRTGMPLVRYDLEDRVRIGLDSCPCGWELPTVEVQGRVGSEISVGGAKIFPRQLEQAVYEAGAAFGLTFWRARIQARSLQVEVLTDSFGAHRAGGSVTEAITQVLNTRFGVIAEVRAVTPTHFLPESALTAEVQMQKPRFIFSAGEDWEKSLIYA